MVDGDTIAISFHGKPEKVRLLCVNTPESVHPDPSRNVPIGKVASEYTRDRLTGKYVDLEFEGARRGNYGRLLAYVLAAPAGAGEACLNAELIERGYGYCDPRFTHPRKAEFRDLQNRARASGVGLWADASDADLPYYYRGKIKLGQ